MVDPARARRLAAVWLVVLALVATSGCTGSGSDEPKAPYIVSYSGAASRLAALDPLEAQEQVRDWARLGLAQSLRLNHKQIVDALYDTTPIRDPLFADLVEQPTGPGRGLFDGTTLHVLVPQDDPHSSRTIGLLLDQHRIDAGADPQQVQVHRYQVRPETQKVELSAQTAASTGEIRAAYGWREVRVDQPQGLADFLAATHHLSRLETRGAEVWATGWRWPDTPGAAVTVEDIAVLQRGYQQTSGPLPGFSLDPRPVSTLDDVRAAIPGLAPALAERTIAGNWAGSGYASAAELATLIEGTLFHHQPPADTLPARGLPADRTQLWALLNFLAGHPVYSQARYDGGLAGTEVGMSLFYTDLVAKDWTSGVGNGVPSKAVPGFVPDPRAVISPSLCPGEPRSESGRLWFGQNDTAFTFEPGGIGIGAQATRLFSRSDGPGGSEVEPSFSFGRGLHWWNQHYREIADYEPQYHRLEQLMRWSGALEWLTTTDSGALPATAGSEIRSDLKFADWYAAHNELRERARLTLVTPPSAREEAVLPVPSDTTPNCNFVQIVGGVSLANGLARSRDLPSGTAALPPGIRRAGPTDPATTAVDPTGSGRIDRITLDATGQATDRVTQVLRREPNVASVEVTGPGRVTPVGDGRLKEETGPRQFENEFRSDGPDSFTVDTRFQDVTLARVESRRPASSGVQQIDISLRPGLLEHLRVAIGRFRQDPVRGLDGAPGVRYRSPGPEGQTVYRYDDGWIEVGPPGSPTSLRRSVVVQVVQPGGGVIEFRAGPRERLSDADVGALEVTQEATVTTFGDMLSVIPPGVPIYRGDVASFVGAEPAATLPAPIPSNAPVRFRVARTTGNPSSPGPIGQEGRTWLLVDPSGEGPTGSRSGGGGGRGSSGGGRASGESSGGAPGAGGGPGGQVVLVTECAPGTQQPPQQDPQQQPQQSEDCQ